MGQLCSVLHCLSNQVLIHDALYSPMYIECNNIVMLHSHMSLDLFCSFVLAVPVKFSASVYHVCTVRGRPSSVTITLEIMKDHNFDFTVNVITRNGTAMSM